MEESLLATYDQMIAHKTIPHSLGRDTFLEQFYPVLDFYLQLQKSEFEGQTLVLGIQGPIGIGKTTMANVIYQSLSKLGYRVASCSIDDFYLDREQRGALRSLHQANPYYRLQRGMPGTHDTNRMQEVIQSIKQRESTLLPNFDKSLYEGEGDVLPLSTYVPEALDVLLLEGWCLGLESTESEQFVSVVKKDDYATQTLKDVEGETNAHHQVLQYVAAYQSVWELVDHYTFLTPADTAHIMDWRLSQEQQLWERKGRGMNEVSTRHFIRHFIPFLFYLAEHTAKNTTGAQIIQVGKDRGFV